MISKNTVYVADLNGVIYSVDRNSGQVNWESSVDSSFNAPPSKSNNRLYIGDQNGIPFLMTATVTTNPEFAVLDRTPLFDITEFEPSSPHSNYDVSRDGQQFLMVQSGASTEAESAELTVVLNWFEELTRLVPTD